MFVVTGSTRFIVREREQLVQLQILQFRTFQVSDSGRLATIYDVGARSSDRRYGSNSSQIGFSVHDGAEVRGLNSIGGIISIFVISNWAWSRKWPRRCRGELGRRKHFMREPIDFAGTSEPSILSQLLTFLVQLRSVRRPLLTLCFLNSVIRGGT